MATLAIVFFISFCHHRDRPAAPTSRLALWRRPSPPRG